MGRNHASPSPDERADSERPTSGLFPSLASGIRTRIIHPAPNDLTSFPFLLAVVQEDHTVEHISG